LIPSSLPLALAVLLVASGTARALDQSELSPHLDFGSRALVNQSAAGGTDPAGSDGTVAESTLSAEFGNSEGLDRKSTPALKFRLGRLSALGRSPGAAPPAYGEIGIDIAPLPGLSLVPSYKVVLDDDSAESSGAVSGQVLKLGARIPF
jgi:hypothetical protein